MSRGKDWRSRLEEAARHLEQTKEAPAWLATAVRDSIMVADALAPRAAEEAAPDDFFYPH
jgi:hypothetical protein